MNNFFFQNIKKILINIFKFIGFIPKLKDIRVSKKSNKLKLYKTITGEYFLPKYHYQDIIRNHIIKNKIYDKPIFDCAKKYIKDESIFLDIGANYGQMSIIISKLKKNLETHSFEANNFIYYILKKNLELNKVVGKCYNVAVTDNITKSYYFPKENKDRFKTLGSYNLKEAENFSSSNIKSLKIDDLSFDKNISFMKIDVQGLDLNVMKGAKSTIIFHKMPIIFEYETLFQNEMNYNFQEYINFVNEIDYKFENIIGSNNFLITPK